MDYNWSHVGILSAGLEVAQDGFKNWNEVTISYGILSYPILSDGHIEDTSQHKS